MDELKLQSLLQNQVHSIDSLLDTLDAEQLRLWREKTLMILDQMISEESKYYKNFEDISYTANIISTKEKNIARNREAMIIGLGKAKASLNAVLFGVKEGLL